MFLNLGYTNQEIMVRMHSYAMKNILCQGIKAK